MNFLDKLDYLMKKNGLNKRTLSIKSEIPYTTIDAFYKRGYENAKLSTMKKLSSYFNVSMDYLVFDEILDENFGRYPELKPDEDEVTLLNKYRSLNSRGWLKLEGYLDCLLDDPSYIAEEDSKTFQIAARGGTKEISLTKAQRVQLIDSIQGLKDKPHNPEDY